MTKRTPIDLRESTLQEPWAGGVSVLFELGDVLVDRRTAHQHILIAETDAYGRTLFLDGWVQSTEADEALYHEPLIHPALVVHGAPRNVLVAGAGEGATLREILRHPAVARVVAVDLDVEVVDACRRHLPGWSAGAFEDPRVELRVEDAQQTLATMPDGWADVIVLDITDPVADGPAVDLFTVRFFRTVRRVLADDGIVVLQAGELDPMGMDVARTVRATLEAAFEWAHFGHMFVPSFHAIWGLALAGRRAHVLQPTDLAARIDRLPRHLLQVYSETCHRATLELPPFLRRELDKPGRVITGESSERHVAYQRPP